MDFLPQAYPAEQFSYQSGLLALQSVKDSFLLLFAERSCKCWNAPLSLSMVAALYRSGDV